MQLVAYKPQPYRRVTTSSVSRSRTPRCSTPARGPRRYKLPSLQAAEARSLGSAVVPLGTLVQIAVSDPSALLPQWNDISSDGGLIVGIFHGDRVWTPAVRNPNKTLSVAVPAGSTYNLWVFSRQFNFSAPAIGATSGGVVAGSNSLASNGALSTPIVAGTEPTGGYQISIISAKN